MKHKPTEQRTNSTPVDVSPVIILRKNKQTFKSPLYQTVLHASEKFVYQTLRMSMVLHIPYDIEESKSKDSRHGFAENISGRSCTKTLDPGDTDTALCSSPSLSHLFADLID